MTKRWKASEGRDPLRLLRRIDMRQHHTLRPIVENTRRMMMLEPWHAHDRRDANRKCGARNLCGSIQIERGESFIRCALQSALPLYRSALS